MSRTVRSEKPVVHFRNAGIKPLVTDDDVVADTIPGKHSNFADQNEDASYVADVLLRHIRSAHNVAVSRSVSRPYIRLAEPGTHVELPDQLILIACSHTKRDGGTSSFPGIAPAGWIPQQSLRQRLISKRTYVYSLLDDAKLADGFERGGNRAHQPANVDLKYGPDLGGTSVVGDEGRYLPAFQRYNGRSYVPVSSAAWDALHQNQNRIRVLIMSGL